MGFRFKKSIKLAPGIKLNLNKKSTGITFGGKGFHYTMNSKGKRTTSVGIPGTGLSYSTSSNKKNQKSEVENLMNNNENGITEKNPKKKKKGCLTAIILCFLFIIGIGSCGGDDTSDTGESTSVTTNASTTVNEASAQTSATATYSENTTTEKETTQEQTTTERETTTKKETTTQKPTTTKKQTTTQKQTTTKKETTTKRETTTRKKVETTKAVINNSQKIYRTKSGKKYHYENPCGNGKYFECTPEEATRLGLDPCEKCVLN